VRGEADGNDGLHRLARAEEGTLVSGSITSRTRDELWTLTQTGNFAVTRLDLDGDGDFTGSGEHDDTRTHNVVNELLARDTDSDTNDDVTLGYDAVGNLVDDGEQYTYVYDAFGRLRRMRTQGDDDYAEFTYNGLNFKTGQVFDTDSDGDLGDETVERQVYDAGWRIVAVYRGGAVDPYEQYVWHNAGLDGLGESSYIDALVLRDRDADLDENAVLEERLYYCQSWRVDVVAVVDSTGTLIEGAHYSAYGVPACYEFWPQPAATLWSVRHRVLHSDLGRWTRRDPIGHIDGSNLYTYALGRPSILRDPMGLYCDDPQCVPDPAIHCSRFVGVACLQCCEAGALVWGYPWGQRCEATCILTTLSWCSKVTPNRIACYACCYEIAGGLSRTCAQAQDRERCIDLVIEWEMSCLDACNVM
jgi:RHS repeat-associated protein